MIIAITGHKGHGKDTIGDVLVREFGFVKYSIAGPLKKAAQEIFSFTDEQVFGDYNIKDQIDPRFGVSPRKILQVIGTELFQYDIYNHLPELIEKIPPRKIWILRFKWWYEHTDWLNVVITDLRFPHEAEVIKELGGIIIKVYRPALNLGKDIHPSEKEIDDIEFDYLLVSVEDIDAYRDQARKLFNEILKEQIEENRKRLYNERNVYD